MNYIEEYRQIHAANPNYGQGSGAKVREAIARLWGPVPFSVLDFGCGRSRMIFDIWPEAAVYWRYDPAIPAFSSMPPPPEVLTFGAGLCTDVLEHLPEETLHLSLSRLRRWSADWCFIICTRPAGQKLSDGSNAHCTVRPAEWWLELLQQFWPEACRVDLPLPADRPGFFTFPPRV